MRYSLLLFLVALLGALAQPAWADAPTATVTGTVRDAAGNPVADAFLSLPANSDIIAHEFSDSQGHYVYGDLSVGTPVGPICASPGPNGPVYPGYPVQDVWGCVGPFTLTAGTTLIEDIAILPHGSSLPSGGASEQSTGTSDRGWVFGTVMQAGAKMPVPGAVVQLVSTPLRTTTDAAGRYQFPALSTTDGANGGSVYTVSVTPPADYTVVGNASQQVTVQADHGVEADFTLQAMPCHFVLGFLALHAAIPTAIGDCVDDEQHNSANGDALQHTAHGLLVWRKADNFTAFTDGYHTWVNGPDGVQERLNSQRFPWEANPNRLPVVH